MRVSKIWQKKLWNLPELEDIREFFLNKENFEFKYSN